MKKYGVAVACALVLPACGGGSGSGSEQSLISNASWLAGSSLTYQQSSVVTGNNTVNSAFRVTRSMAAADGSYTVTTQDLSGPNTVNGVVFGGHKSVSVHDAQQRLVRTTNTLDGKSDSVCEFTPPQAPMPSPLLQDSTWTADWTQACTNSVPQSWKLSHGHVVGLETVTVPAGTYETVHVYQEYDAGTAKLAPSFHEVTNTWYDRASGMKIKYTRENSYLSGAPSSGYVMSLTQQLAAVQKGS